MGEIERLQEPPNGFKQMAPIAQKQIFVIRQDRIRLISKSDVHTSELAKACFFGIGPASLKEIAEAWTSATGQEQETLLKNLSTEEKVLLGHKIAKYIEGSHVFWKKISDKAAKIIPQKTVAVEEKLAQEKINAEKERIARENLNQRAIYQPEIFSLTSDCELIMRASKEVLSHEDSERAKLIGPSIEGRIATIFKKIYTLNPPNIQLLCLLQQSGIVSKKEGSFLKYLCFQELSEATLTAIKTFCEHPDTHNVTIKDIPEKLQNQLPLSTVSKLRTYSNWLAQYPDKGVAAGPERNKRCFTLATLWQGYFSCLQQSTCTELSHALVEAKLSDAELLFLTNKLNGIAIKVANATLNHILSNYAFFSEYGKQAGLSTAQEAFSFAVIIASRKEIGEITPQVQKEFSPKACEFLTTYSQLWQSYKLTSIPYDERPQKCLQATILWQKHFPQNVDLRNVNLTQLHQDLQAANLTPPEARDFAERLDKLGQDKNNVTLLAVVKSYKSLSKHCGTDATNTMDDPQALATAFETTTTFTEFHTLYADKGVAADPERDTRCMALATLWQNHFSTPTARSKVDLTTFRHELEAANLSDDEITILTDLLRELSTQEKNQTLLPILFCYTSLAESGKVNKRLTISEAFDNALIIQHEIPKKFREQIQGKNLSEGVITIDVKGEHARRIFWKARDVKNITDIKDFEIYLSTQHEIRKGGIKMVTTGIKVNTTAPGYIYTAKDLLAYQESQESSPSQGADAEKLLAHKEVIESLAPIANIENAPIVKTHFATLFEPEKGQVKFGAFSELCEEDFLDKIRNNPTKFSDDTLPFTEKNFTDCLNSLIISLDTLHFLAMCHDQQIVHGDMKLENILLKKDKSGLQRGKGCDFDLTLDYKKIDDQVEALKKTPEYNSQSEKESWLESKKKELENQQQLYGNFQSGTYGTEENTSVDIKKGFDGSREQSVAADCWAGGAVLFKSLTLRADLPNDTIDAVNTFIQEWTDYSDSLKNLPAANIMHTTVAASLELAMKLFNPDYKIRPTAKQACTELAEIIQTAYNAAKNEVDQDGNPIDLSRFETALADINEFLNPSKPAVTPQIPP